MKGPIMRRTTFVFLMIAGAMISHAQQPGSERFVQVINRLVEAMNNQDYAGIVKEYDKGMAAAFPIFKTTYFFKNNFDTFGKILKTDPPQVKAPDQAICVLYAERGTQDLTLYIDNLGKIKGFLFTTHALTESQPAPDQKPASAQTVTPPVTDEQKPVTAPKTVQPAVTPATSEQTSSATQKPLQISVPAQTITPKPAASKPSSDTSQVIKTAGNLTPSPAQPVTPIVKDKQQTVLYPPFKGNWVVVSGGEMHEGNAQRNLLQQQYAYEFSGMDTDGLRYKNDGKANADYAGYGKDVIAPASGTVVEVIDGIRENSPGMRNTYALIGNTIIIQHTEREYSVLAFLKQGSVRVKVGDKITRGQVIAQCGSSGNATEPVIHYHLQDSPYLQNAKSIKFYFERAIIAKDGKKELKMLHCPGMGDVISLEQ
jgi:murein DD-endopeptidase MepM/ murein hydrolase activator NlpD